MRSTRSAGALLVGGQAPTSSSFGGFRPPSAGSVFDKSSLFGTTGPPQRRAAKSGTTFDLLSGLQKFDFGHARGEIGLHWDDTVVTRVSGQAKKLGVRPGWKIFSIDGFPVKTGDDVWLRLNEAKWQWRSTVVQFCTNMQAIRHEQATFKVDRIVGEEKRLARLPFESTGDSTHAENIKEEFAYQGAIDKPEDRAITLVQLKRIHTWVEGQCHRWRDVLPPTISKTSRFKLNLSFMNMYHLNHWLIKPGTKEKDCSFVELLTKEKQPPAWYVISWWGEPIAEFLRCIEQHVILRNLKSDSPFWVSAYASRQHSMADCLDGDMKESCYYKALVAAKFQTLLIVDSLPEPDGPGGAFNRTWCQFELLMCMDAPGAGCELDIATPTPNKVLIVTKGLTEEEYSTERGNPGQGFKAKFEREKSFPLEVAEVALQAKIQSSQATDFHNRCRIVNLLIGKDAATDVKTDQELYLKLNRRMHSIFALTFWRRVMSGAGDSEMQRLQARVVDSLRESDREELELSLSYCAAGEEKMALLARGLPSCLKRLKVDAQGAVLADKSLALLAGGLPSGLEELLLDVSNNDEITNAGVTHFISQAPTKLQKQSINLKQTACTKEFTEAADNLDGIRQCIEDESQKGASCCIVNLVPQPGKGKGMILQVERCRLKEGFS